MPSPKEPARPVPRLSVHGTISRSTGRLTLNLAAYRRAIQSGDPTPAARAGEALERLTAEAPKNGLRSDR